MMKHTPGPWKMGSMITCGTEAQHIEITRKGDPYMVAKVCVQGDMVSIGRPNARLIAAAPTMLDALKTAQVRIFMLEGISDEYKKAGNAISDAEGGTYWAMDAKAEGR